MGAPRSKNRAAARRRAEILIVDRRQEGMGARTLTTFAPAFHRRISPVRPRPCIQRVAC